MTEPLSYVREEYTDEDGSKLVGHWVKRGEFHSLASLTPVEDVERLGRLFAAAPELLEIVRFYQGYCEYDCYADPDLGVEWAKAKNLLAKIEGAK